MMEKMSGVPILIAILLGILFPYQALALMPLGFAFLFLLMVLAGLTVEWSRLKGIVNRPADLLVGLGLLYLLFPPLQWALSRMLISDRQYLFGLLFASLTPAAIVAPFFSRMLDGDAELSFLLMVVSTLVCPIIAPLLLRLLAGPSIALEVFSLVKFLALLVTLPLLASCAVRKLLPGVVEKIMPHMGLLNIALLSVLIYILSGNAVGRLNLNYASVVVVGKIVFLCFIQDFGVLFVARYLLSPYYDRSRLNSLAITLSMKNVAISGAVLLYYDPRAALPSTVGFVAHACLFSFLPLARKYLAPAVKDA